MREEKRINSTNFVGEIHAAQFKAAEEPLSSKQLFRIAAELQELLSKRRYQKRRYAVSENLTHYVE